MEYKAYGKKATRFGFGEGLVALGERNENIIVLGGDITGSVMTSYFKEKFPERFFSIGIAEQNATTVAVGLALSGKVPFFASYGAFSACRCMDFIRISVCYNEANVKIGGGHAGLTVGPDGATHQVLEDVAAMRVLPKMTVVVPSDYLEAKKATVAIGEMYGPAFLRFGRDGVSQFTTDETPFELGRAITLRDGKHLSIIANGALVWEALLAAEELSKEGIEARVINMHTVKPIDEAAIISAAKETGAIVTAEEHQVMGGLGSAIAEVVVKNFPVPMEFVGVEDTFGGSGEPSELMKYFGLTSTGILSAAKKVLKRRG